jgi:hypothetical protein
MQFSDRPEDRSRYIIRILIIWAVVWWFTCSLFIEEEVFEFPSKKLLNKQQPSRF